MNEPDLHARGRVTEHLEQARRGFLSCRDLSDEEVEVAMVEEIDQALGQPARATLPAGTRLLTEGQAIDGIWIVLDGTVRLSRRLEDQDVIFHARTVGPVIGLLGLALGTDSFFTCEASSDISVLSLTLEELDTALTSSSMLSAYFVTVLLRSLARRHRRAIELQIEVNALNSTLSAERDHLTMALRQLEQAQSRLVASEKMATLGELAAGVAHDLNNPVAAITRAADFVAEDLAGVAVTHPQGDILGAMMQAALEQPPVSAREERALRSALAKSIGDEQLARRIVKVGIVDHEHYLQHFEGLDEDARAKKLGDIERYYHLGTSLRNIRSCAERITGLVASLRSYARADRAMTPDVDVHKGLEDTLLLFGHALRGVEVERGYEELPHIECSLGEINQVWMNLVSNAIDAMQRKGHLRIRTHAPDPKHVRVCICDDGPGIPAENIARVFDMNFTTKHGRVEFGVGLGLTICKQIVEKHGGTISVTSKPGDTCFTVLLPVKPPAGGVPH